MGDTGSEGSKPPANVNIIPPRCPCGFWGSSKTMNLCSKCFADFQKKQPDEDCATKSSSSSSCSQPDIFCNDANNSLSPALTSMPNIPENPTPGPAAPAQTEVSSTGSDYSALCTPTKRSLESASESESDVSPAKQSRVGDVSKEEEASSSLAFLSSSSASSSSRSGPKQRNRKRCHRCQAKLELVQQELGSCRCGYVFCMLHRLPEQHECMFDHLGRGRQEAVLKMVKLDRKVGRSCQRIGEECSWAASFFWCSDGILAPLKILCVFWIHFFLTKALPLHQFLLAFPCCQDAFWMNQTQESKNVKSKRAKDFGEFLTIQERVTKPNEEYFYMVSQ